MMAGVAYKQTERRQVIASPLVDTSTSDEILNFKNLHEKIMEKVKLKNWFVVRSPQRLYIFNLTKKLNGNLSVKNTFSIDDGLIVKVFGENNDNPLFILRLYRWPQLQNLIEQLSIDVKRESNLDSNKEPIPVAVTTIKEDDTNDCQADAAGFEFCATNAVDPHPTFPETLHTSVTVKDQDMPFLRVKSENELMDPVPMSAQSTILYRPYTCSECGKRFDQNAKLMIHLRIHEQKLCPICNETYTGTMARHKTRKHKPKSNKKSQQCHLCGSEYENTRLLRDHMELNHIGYDEFFCNICNDGKNFKARNVMQTHMRRQHRPKMQQQPLEQARGTNESPNHSNANQSSQICSTCGKEFSTNRKLITHMRRHDQRNARPCPLCKKSYFELSRHMETHSKVKKYVCDQCGDRFSQLSSLNDHVEIRHSPEGEFFCDICNNGLIYRSKFNLKRHLYQHNSVEYRCQVCGKKFGRRNSLADHVKLHAGKSYVCHLCGQSFKHPKYLRKHLNGHKGRKKKPCTLCDKEYANGFDLRLHMKKVHDVILKPIEHNINIRYRVAEPIQENH